MRITRTSLALLGVAAMTVAAVPALGGDDGVTSRDDWKTFDPHDTVGEAAGLEAPVRFDGDVPIERATDNIRIVAHADTGPSSDIMFQRRVGEQVLRGKVIDDTRDYAFVGGIDGSNYGFSVVDVTEPTAPEVLSFTPCGAFHNDIVVYENLVVLGSDGGGGACGTDDPLYSSFAPAGNGVHVFDVTDPAEPVLLQVFKASTPNGGVPGAGPHNISVNAEAGLLYLSTAGFRVGSPLWGYVDLDDFGPDTRLVTVPQRTISREAVDGCHDQGLAYDFVDLLGAERDLVFCASIVGTHIWDVTEDPTRPVHVSTIENPGVSIHHGARLAADGRTLVLNDELAGAAAAAGCQGGAPAGGQWLYDISQPEAPVLLGVASTSELNPAKLPCTSHFYNNIPYADDTTRIVTGWYRSGMIVHDLTDLPLPPTEPAHILPQGATFWAAYAYRGYLYGASFGSNSGLFVAELDGMEDLEPLPQDEGTSWSRWSGVPAVPFADR